MRIPILFIALCLLAGCDTVSYADKVIIKEDNIEGYSINQWCNAIYMAEGGSKTRHPYGILDHYKRTSPRQACINTVKHKHRDWLVSGRRKPFLAYLGAKYCPVGCNNDNGTNKNWISNVGYWLKNGG